MRTQLEAIAGELGVAVDDDGWRRLAMLRDLWLRYGRAMSLVGASTDAELVPHVADALATMACAAGVRDLTADVRWIDVGSGGGLPALVIAALSACRLTMVEPRQKRAGFLALAARTICREVVISRARIDGSTWNENGVVREICADYDVASSRATFTPELWISVGEKLVTDGGVVIAHLREGGPTPREGAVSRVVVQADSRICAYDATRLRRASR